VGEKGNVSNGSPFIDRRQAKGFDRGPSAKGGRELLNFSRNS
jgi:hypothetical protein